MGRTRKPKAVVVGRLFVDVPQRGVLFFDSNFDSEGRAYHFTKLRIPTGQYVVIVEPTTPIRRSRK